MFNIAKKIAYRSEHKQHHHSCVITKGGKIIATGYNHKFLHAETHALRKVVTQALRQGKTIKGLTLYSFRWRKNNSWGNAKPCKDCMKFIDMVHLSIDPYFIIQNVVYTNEEGVLTKL